MSKTSYSVRLTEEQNLVLQRRMRNLGYQKAAPFLTDAALGHLGRDAADGDLGWRHDVLERLNDILAAQDDLTVRKKAFGCGKADRAGRGCRRRPRCGLICDRRRTQ